MRKYLGVTVMTQLSDEFAVTVEPMIGPSAWHALEEMARAKAWSLESDGPPPWWAEPTLDGTSIPYYFFPEDNVLVYIFADPGWLDRLWMRMTSFGRRLRRAAARVSVGARAACRRMSRRLRRAVRRRRVQPRS